MEQQLHWKRTFFTIALGQAISLLGSAGVQFALIWRLAEQTASPVVMGLAGLVAFLPMTVISPFAGVAADKYSRKAICMVADLSMGLAALVYAVLLCFMDLPVWSVLVILGLRGVGGAFHQPSIQSIIPQLVPSDQLIRANGWMQLLTSGSFILGPVIGAALYAAVPMPVILLTDVAGAVVASGALAVVAVPPLEHHEPKDVGFFAQLKEGMEVYRRDRALFTLVLAEAMCMFFYAPLSSFYPLMTSDFFALSPWHGGVVETGFAVGMMVCALLFSSGVKVKHKIGVSYLGLFGLGVTSAVCGLLPPVFAGWLAFAGICTLMGAFGNVHSIPLTAYMQETIPPEKMGRAFSFLALIGSLSMPVGLAVGSPIAELVGVHAWFFISGIGILLVVTGTMVVSKLFQR